MGAHCSCPGASAKETYAEVDGPVLGKDGSGYASPTNAFKVAILVQGATNLLHKDYWWEGESDPYCICRLGPMGSKWREKSKDTERRSAPIIDEQAPQWNLIISYDKKETQGAELEIRVLDHDMWNRDDFMGSLSIPVGDLALHENEVRDYPLHTGAGKPAGALQLMAGPRVERALLEKLRKADDAKGSYPWWWTVVASYGQFFARELRFVLYNVTMLSFLAAGQKAGGSALRNWFLHRSSDNSGKNTYLWKGPFPTDCITYSGHADVTEKLKQLGERLGTNNGDGLSYRANFLGFQSLGATMWPEKKVPLIGLGESQENHAFCRKLICKLSGPPGEGRWTPEEVRKWAKDFWDGRMSVNAANCKMWVVQVLHRIHLDLDLTDEEANDFVNFQFQVLLIIPFPETMEHGPLRLALQVDSVLQQKARWLERYKDALRKLLPEEAASWSTEQLTLSASVIMDALLFAGGVSVPTVLAYCLAVPWTKWGRENLPSGFTLRKSVLWVYVLEMVRRFPPVGALHYRDRSYGSKVNDTDVFCNVMMASFDERVWPNASKFILRPPEEYVKNSLMWADAALAPHNASPNSHACPAKHLSIRMCVDFMEAFMRSSMGDARVDKDEPLTMESWVLKPADTAINEYQPSTGWSLHARY